MNREQLYYVLYEQQENFKAKQKIIPRELTSKVLSLLRLKLPIVITGLRRVGKSTLLKIIVDELKLSEKQYLYINFNDERLISFLPTDFQKIIDFIYEHNYNKRCYLLLDEIQEADHWEKWVDRIKEQYPMIITGSNSKLLSKEISTVLTGRNISVHLDPFSFQEILKFKKINQNQLELDLKLQSKLRGEFSQFLKGGGIPKYVIEKESRILTELYENILYRDIIKRFSPSLEKSIKEISSYLLSSVSKEISLRTLAKFSGVSNFSTLKSITNTFEKAFLFYFISKFDYSIKKQIQNPRKVYCVDNGFLDKISFRFSGDQGKFLENLVFIELRRRGKEMYYFSEKQECDFVIKEGTKINEAIQVCHQLTEENEKREIKGLLAALDKFNLKKGLLLTLDQEEEIKEGNKKIVVKPIWKWLLD